MSGAPKPRRLRPWTAIELETLRLTYFEAPVRIIAKAVGRTVPAVSSRAWAMGLRKGQPIRNRAIGERWKTPAAPIGAIAEHYGVLKQKVAAEPGAYETNWKRLHILNWEREHGPVPDGYMLTFRDGDRRNVDLDNLELITNAECLRRNSWNHFPRELREVMALLSELKRAIRKREHEEQDRRLARSSVRHARSTAGSKKTYARRPGTRHR